MTRRKKVSKIGGSLSRRKQVLRNLACQLIKNGKLDTTHAKAKECQKHVEKVINKAKAGDTHARRQAFKHLQDKEAVDKLFSRVIEDYSDRDGGYTRLLKLPPRRGDGARMARLMLV